MGNEQAVPAQGSPNNKGPKTPTQITNSSSTSNIIKKSTATHQLLIIVRGQRYTGKTTLVNRMKSIEFKEEYVPSPILESSEIPWKSELICDDVLNVRVWDVVEKALIPTNSIEKKEYPDATTVDTYKHADGLVIMVDPRHADTIQLADRIIKDAPLDLPILVFSNFMDEDKVTPVMPQLLQNRIGRFTYLPGSLKNNQGLIELSKWLLIPYTYSKKRQYLSLYKSTSEDLEELLRDSHEDATKYITLEGAIESAPKPAPKPAPIAPIVVTQDIKQKDLPSPTLEKPVNNEKVIKPDSPAEKVAKVEKISEKPNLKVQTKPNKNTEKPAVKKSASKDKADFWSDDDVSDDALKLPSDHDSDDLRPNPQVKGKGASKTSPVTQAKKVTTQTKEKDEGAFWGDDDSNDADNIPIKPLPPLSLPDKKPALVQPAPLIKQVPEKPVEKTMTESTSNSSLHEEMKSDPSKNNDNRPQRKVKKIRRSVKGKSDVNLPPDGDYETV